MDRTTPALPVSDTQAIAARLTVIAERLDELELTNWSAASDLRFLLGHVAQARNEGWQKGYSASEETYGLLRQKFSLAEQENDRLSAHVETLTQQVADSVRASAQNGERWAKAEQENARLTAEAKVYGDAVAEWRPIVERVKQAEQQRDAAHAALRKVRAHTSYVAISDRPEDMLALTSGLLASIERIVDAALAASAPQKPTKPVSRHVCGAQGYCPGPPHYDPICPGCKDEADRRTAPAQETERGR